MWVSLKLGGHTMISISQYTLLAGNENYLFSMDNIVYLDFKQLFCVRKIQEVCIYGFGVRTRSSLWYNKWDCYAHVFAYNTLNSQFAMPSSAKLYLLSHLF
jgi:hypothetical protein